MRDNRKLQGYAVFRHLVSQIYRHICVILELFFQYNCFVLFFHQLIFANMDCLSLVINPLEDYSFI